MPKMCEAQVFNPWCYTYATCTPIHTHTHIHKGIPPHTHTDPHTQSERASERVNNNVVQRGIMSLVGTNCKGRVEQVPSFCSSEYRKVRLLAGTELH